MREIGYIRLEEKTLQFVADEISKIYNVDLSDAALIVKDSFLPEMYAEMPDYVTHYDAEYWAREIMEGKEREEIDH